MTSQPVQPEYTTFVGTEAAQGRIAPLRSRRGAPERVDGIRAEMAEARPRLRRKPSGGTQGSGSHRSS